MFGQVFGLLCLWIVNWLVLELFVLVERAGTLRVVLFCTFSLLRVFRSGFWGAILFPESLFRSSFEYVLFCCEIKSSMPASFSRR